MKTPQQTLLSIFLTQEVGFSLDYLHRVRAEWFDIALHRKVFDEILENINKGVKPDILNIVKGLRDKKQLDPAHITQVYDLGTYDYKYALSIESVITEVELQYQTREVMKLVHELNRSVSENTFTVDSFMTRIEQVKESMNSKTKTVETNIETIESIIHRHNKAKDGTLQGLALPFPNLQDVVLLEDVDMMVVGARPAMGKTAFAITVSCILSFMQDKRIAFFSLEMSKQQIMRRMIAYLTGINSNYIKYGKCNAKEIGLIRALEERKEWDNLHIFEGSHTATDITSKCTKLKHTQGLDLIIVDYLQKITATKGKSRFEQMSHNSNDVKRLSQNLKVPSLALAQLSRSSVQRGGDKRPVLSDLKDTGDIEQDASIVGFLHRPEYYGLLEDEDGNSTKDVGELCIGKNREGETGVYKFRVDLALSKWEAYTNTEGFTPGSLNNQQSAEF